MLPEVARYYPVYMIYMRRVLEFIRCLCILCVDVYTGALRTYFHT